MVIPIIPKSGDYNTDGVLEAFCTNCGKGYIQIDSLISRISKRNIKTLLDKIFTRNGLRYNKKIDVEKEILSDVRDRKSIVNFLSAAFDEDRNFIESNLTGDLLIP